MIIVEGYDCSGKSTLVEKLGRWTGFTTPHAGGPPKDLNHTRRCLARCAARMTRPMVQDRVTQISESVYGMLERPAMSALSLSRIGDLRLARLMVYCRPARTTIYDKLEHHVRKDHDTQQLMLRVLANAETLIGVYDTVMCMARDYCDVFVYDYENPTHEDALKSIIEEIQP